MDLVCTCCGEPWHSDYVLHDEPDGFDRSGAMIRGCPVCRGKRPADQSRQQRDRLDTIAELAWLFGHDIDALAGCLDDFGLV